jgi:hypothetical protein
MRDVVALGMVKDGAGDEIQHPETAPVAEHVTDQAKARRDLEAARVAGRQDLGDLTGVRVDLHEVEIESELFGIVPRRADRHEGSVVDPACRGSVGQIACRPDEGRALVRDRREQPDVPYEELAVDIAEARLRAVDHH